MQDKSISLTTRILMDVIGALIFIRAAITALALRNLVYLVYIIPVFIMTAREFLIVFIFTIFIGANIANSAAGTLIHCRSEKGILLCKRRHPQSHAYQNCRYRQL